MRLGGVPGPRGRHRRVVCAVVLLLVTAGCAGVASTDDGGRTVNPALAETPTATSTPPGGFPAGVDGSGVDVDAVIDAHRAALGDGSWTVSLTRSVTDEDGTIERSRALVSVDGPNLLYSFERVRGENSLSTTHWSNATASASRRSNWRGAVTTTGNPTEAGGPAGLDPTGGAWLFAAFVDTRPAYAGTEETANGTVTVLEASEGRIDRPGLPDRRRVSLRARVGPDGVVRSLVLRYGVFYNDDPAVVRIVLRTVDVGSTTVPRPDWVDGALANASAENGTGVPTTTANETTGTPSGD